VTTRRMSSLSGMLAFSCAGRLVRRPLRRQGCGRKPGANKEYSSVRARSSGSDCSGRR
jgi:hypothetical protein